MSILSDQRLRALQAEILASCAEVTQYWQQSLSSSEPANFRQPVLDAVYSAFQKYAREQTRLHSPAARLPDELLVEMFTYLDFRDRICTATVCHRWRTVSLNAPGRLWSTIPALVDLHTWSALLNRARHAPVTLERIYVDRRNFSQVSAIIEEHMYHIKSMDLMPPVQSDWEVLTDDDDDAWVGYLNDIFVLQGPALESITIHFQEPDDQKYLPILASTQLRSIKLHNINLGCLSPCEGSFNLTTLVIDSGGFTVDDWPLLSSFPSLTDFALRLSFPMLENVPALSIKFPYTLRRLHLEVDDGIFRLLISSLIPDIRRVPLWTIDFLGPTCPTLQDLLPLLPGPFADVSLQTPYHIDFMVTERTGEQRICRNVKPHRDWLQVLADVEKLSYSTITSILPDELLGPSFALDVLRELTFDVSPLHPFYALAYGQPGRNGLEWPYGPCKQLHTVRVRSHGDSVRVLLSSVIAVLSRLLDSTPRRKLSLLEFNNIDLIPDSTNTDELSLLHELAETVSTRSEGDVWPECHLVWNQPWSDVWDVAP